MHTFVYKPLTEQQANSVKSAEPHATLTEPVDSTIPAHRLQPTAVDRLMQTPQSKHNTGTPDFSQIPAHARTPGRIQTKLALGTQGDVYEQEADRVADYVARMAELQRSETPVQNEDSPYYHAKPPGEHLQINNCSVSNTEQITAPQSVHDALDEPGRALDTATRNFMSSSFGFDFSGVRVHTGQRADKAATEIGARAFTVGPEVVFRQGGYVPDTRTGRQLLAHELTHVVQQSGVTPFGHGPLPNRPRPSNMNIQRVPEGPPRVVVPTTLLTTMSTQIRAALGLLEAAGAGTFGPWVAPLLRFLSSNLTYRDSGHQDHGGQELEVALRRRGASRQSTPRIFRLRLVLDDQANPLERAYFQPDGHRGRIVLNIRPTRQTGGTTGQRIDAVGNDALAQILYHEAVHMLRHWHVTYGEDYLPFTGIERSALGLNLYASEITRIERNLRTIFTAVNAARPPARAVPNSSARDFAQRLAEEAMVRGETQFMGAMRGRREQAGTGRVTGGLFQMYSAVDRATPATYLFAFGDMLTPQDRPALSAPGDTAARARQALDDIGLVFDAIIQRHVELRWGPRDSMEAYP